MARATSFIDLPAIRYAPISAICRFQRSGVMELQTANQARTNACRTAPLAAVQITAANAPTPAITNGKPKAGHGPRSDTNKVPAEAPNICMKAVSADALPASADSTY